MSMSPTDGERYCSQKYAANVFVPNSAQESAFVGSYLAALQVDNTF
jgi:hypothetical protein